MLNQFKLLKNLVEKITSGKTWIKYDN